jgi:transmembrane sensor
VAVVAGHRITDLGTKFLIRNEPGRLEVALVEGRARFDAADRKVRPISVELLPGDVVVARNNEMILRHKEAPAMARELGWRRGVVVFDNTTLADAAAEFNRYSKVRLVVANNAGALKINGTFQLNNLEAFAETAQDALGLKLTHHTNQIVISH